AALASAVRTCRCLIVLATGNSGPGIGSATVPAGTDGILSVGAFYTPDMVEWDRGVRPAAPGVWYFSGMGPRSDGGLAPNLVAPGSTLTTVPFWSSPEGFAELEGTSAAAPHLAGLAALLLEAARAEGRDVD